VGSIAHARPVLILLSRGVHTVNDLTRACGFSKSTVHRVLKTLEKHGLAVQDPATRCYYLGPLVQRLNADPAACHRKLVNSARDHMQALANLTEETVAIDVLSRLRYVPLFEIPSRYDLKVTMESKKIGPEFSDLYAGATVKALLSQLPDEELDFVLDNVTLAPETATTVVDRNVLRAQLEEIRRAGVCVTRGERIPGTICIAAPVRHYFLPVVLSVVGPESRVFPRLHPATELLKKYAARLSGRLKGL
jgi:DNA-binding IclR family transcriptional regulator